VDRQDVTAARLSPATLSVTREVIESDADALDIMRWMVDVIVREVRPHRIVLFGSRARGTQRPDSDIDLLVVVPDGTGVAEAEARISLTLLPRPALWFDVVVVTEFTLVYHGDAPWYVYLYALRDGIDVYRRQ
jgi:predicted nucleotidyltransferase